MEDRLVLDEKWYREMLELLIRHSLDCRLPPIALLLPDLRDIITPDPPPHPPHFLLKILFLQIFFPVDV